MIRSKASLERLAVRQLVVLSIFSTRPAGAQLALGFDVEHDQGAAPEEERTEADPGAPRGRAHTLPETIALPGAAW